EANDETEGNQIVAKMIHKRPAIGLAVERPANGVLDEAGLVIFCWNFPQLLDADGICLRIAMVAEAEFADDLLGQRAAAALCKQRVARAQLHASLEILGRLAILTDAHVAGGDADDAAVFLQQFGRREAGVDFDAELLRLGRKPAAEIT